MKLFHLKVARIGNSRGVRIPASTLARYRVGDSVIMEERTEGILLRPKRVASPKLSWEDTARAMAKEPENWGAWDETLSDGLEQLPWDSGPTKRVAEGTYPTARRRRKSSSKPNKPNK
jgi:antitoxin component of MazEF toxin-antitoxin module